MKLRIKYMYEQGKTSYIDMLFQSENMVQLMNRAEYIQKISQYDRKKMDEYVLAKEAVEAWEARLNKSMKSFWGLRSRQRRSISRSRCFLTKRIRS